MSELPYSGLRVLEIGSRIAAGACGRLLADLGATVHVVEVWPSSTHGPGKWRDRAGAVAGKQSVLADARVPADVDAVAALIRACDVVIQSSDADDLPAPWASVIAACPIVCDITAFGSSGPDAGHYADELELQALTGVLVTTGLPGGPATPVGVPVLEMSAAIYAASAIGVALHVLRRDGIGQNIEVALFDVGINALTTFMPAHYAGQQPRRLGNGHGMAVPWNAYPAADGWILICSTNDAQWRRIASLVDPDLAQDKGYAELKARLTKREEIDARITAWCRGLPLAEVARKLGEQGIPCGGIVTIDELEREPNLALRHAVQRALDPSSGKVVRVAGPLLRFDGESRPPVVIPAAEPASSATRHVSPRVTRAGKTRTGSEVLRAPLEGLRVIEIGQLTTAPLAARHLASFGAEVIKVEPPEGESARSWAPLRDGVSHFFIASNGEKRSIALDLRDHEDARRLADLISGADVLVENMKPGALARMGFSPERLMQINPRLVYCAISGFGAHSVYEGRPAVDTVIQAMSGMMDATRSQGVPLKTGISAADIAGGETGLLAILAALARREKTGQGCTIDISMQDIAAWMTQTLWNCPPEPRHYDGAVLSVAEACTHPQTQARELIVVRRDTDGRMWEVFGTPMCLSKTPAQVDTLIGQPSRSGLQWARRHEAGDIDARR